MSVQDQWDQLFLSQARAQTDTFPLFYLEIHGSVVHLRSPVHLNRNEYIICPKFNELMPVCFSGDPIIQGLKGTKNLKQVVGFFAREFPLEYSWQGTRSKSFQIFDHTKPIVDIHFQSDEMFPGILREVYNEIEHPTKRELGRTFLLSGLVEYIRRLHPDGWILCLYACTVLDPVPPHTTQTQEFQKWIKQAQLQLMSGHQLSSYFPDMDLGVKNQPKYRKKLKQHAVVHKPSIRRKTTSTGDIYFISYKGNLGTLEYDYHKPSGTLNSRYTTLKKDMDKEKKFNIHSMKTEINVEYDWMPSFQIVFTPMYRLPNGRLSLHSIQLNFKEVVFLTRNVSGRPWEDLDMSHKKFLKLTSNLDYPNSTTSLKCVYFIEPFEFIILVLRSIDDGLHFITSEGQIFSFYGQPILSLSELMLTRPPLSYEIDIRVSMNQVQIYQTNILIQPIHKNADAIAGGGGGGFV